MQQCLTQEARLPQPAIAQQVEMSLRLATSAAAVNILHRGTARVDVDAMDTFALLHHVVAAASTTL